jgi:hypothetical protein
MNRTLPSIIEHRRLPSPAVTPQALAWHDDTLWISSRDLRRIYAMEPDPWTILEEHETPGVAWAAVSTGKDLRFTIGDEPEDNRYLRSYQPGQGFGEDRVACPELTGSYLSYDGTNCYLSQWYKHRILKLSADVRILREVAVGEEICGHVFVNGMIYLLRGTEQNGERWRIARLDPREDKPEVIDLATVPFACRSLTFDGTHFWANHRAANETVSFTLPDDDPGYQPAHALGS